MDSNPNNEAVKSGRIEATEDVEGHAARFKGIDGPDTDDVEGHAIKARGLVEDNDVEGHATRVRVLDSEPESDEDVEGHMPRIRFAETPEPSDEDGDDTEAHATRVKF